VPRGFVVGAVVAVLLVLVVIGVKLYADSTADSAIGDRSDEVAAMLEDSTPRDFLAFNSGRSVPDSVAREVAEQEDFVSVNAQADKAVIRFQPKGWWAGFTERCVVAVVSDDGVTVVDPKTACVRVDPDAF